MHVPIYPVLGNHDYEGDVAAWYRMAERNPRWQYPNRHYTIKVGDLATIFMPSIPIIPIGIAEALPDFDNSTKSPSKKGGKSPLAIIHCGRKVVMVADIKAKAYDLGDCARYFAIT